VLNHGNGELHILYISHVKEGVPAELNEPFRRGRGRLIDKNLSAAMGHFCIESCEAPLEKLLTLRGVCRDTKTTPPSERFGKSL
jgi:hypothetical protein